MDARQSLSDRELLRKAADDTGYLAVLVRRYRAPLYSFAYRFVGDRETAEDRLAGRLTMVTAHSAASPQAQD